MTQRIPEEVARTIDYTDVRKDITYGDVERICLEARDHRIGAVVVPSALVHRAAVCVADSGVAVSCYHPPDSDPDHRKDRETERG